MLTVVVAMERMTELLRSNGDLGFATRLHVDRNDSQVDACGRSIKLIQLCVNPLVIKNHTY